jgi:hypothetical protein
MVGSDSDAAAAEALSELHRVLRSPILSHSTRQARLLEYLCMKAIAGEGDTLKEYTIAVEVFDRPANFGQSPDSVVRVEVLRLRKKLERYYSTEASADPLRIEIPVGQYVPQFVPNGAAAREAPSQAAERTPAPRERWSRWRIVVAIAVPVALAVMALLYFSSYASQTGRARMAAASIALSPPGDSVRILAGYDKSQYRDRYGANWLGDRYFTGGKVTNTRIGADLRHTMYIRCARDSGLFQHMREGQFAYAIPVKPGIYELRLHFAESHWGPSLPAGGSEGYRLFSIDVNGKRAIRGFDVFAAAGDCLTATTLVFGDVQPAPDGKVHLDFRPEADEPFVNAIELVPGIPGRMLPIRMVVGDQFYRDAAGLDWTPDAYFTSGRVAPATLPVKGTPDPDLYARERFGNFTYRIPAMPGSYTVRLHFAETHYGPTAGILPAEGARVFDIYCNGTALIRNYDIYKAAGGDFRATTLTFRKVQAADRQLVLTFARKVDYASVRAIEVLDEGR